MGVVALFPWHSDVRCFHYEYFVLNINTENAKAERGKAGSVVRRLAWKADYQSTGSLNGSFPFVNYKVELFPAQKGLDPSQGWSVPSRWGGGFCAFCLDLGNTYVCPGSGMGSWQVCWLHLLSLTRNYPTLSTTCLLLNVTKPLLLFSLSLPPSLPASPPFCVLFECMYVRVHRSSHAHVCSGVFFCQSSPYYLRQSHWTWSSPIQ